MISLLALPLFQIFEAEQANLHAEMIITTRILSNATAKALRTLLSLQMIEERAKSRSESLVKAAGKGLERLYDGLILPCLLRAEAALDALKRSDCCVAADVLREGAVRGLGEDSSDIAVIAWVGGSNYQQDIFLNIFCALRTALDICIAIAEQSSNFSQDSSPQIQRKVVHIHEKILNIFKSTAGNFGSSKLHPWIHAMLAGLQSSTQSIIFIK